MAATELFGDFCLACDRVTNGTTFCSQACRLAELELYTGSDSTVSYHTTHRSQYQRSPASASPGFHLPPAYDFASHRQSSSTSLSTSSSLSSSPPSSPKTSTYSKLTDQVRNDLRDYVGAFDQTRTIRRRVSMQSN